MAFFNNLAVQLRGVWDQANKPARAVFAALTVLCLAIVAGVGYWSSRPDFIPLATDLSPTVAADIVSTLDAAGIDNHMNFSGSAVLVPKCQWNQARLAAGDQMGPAPLDQNGLEESFLSDPAMARHRLLRQKEEAIARSIERLQSVRVAKVHIGQAEQSPFVQERSPATAAVVLELNSGETFTQEQVASISQLVASSVQGLLPDAVTITDTKGHNLMAHSPSADADINSQFSYQRKVEAELSAKAERVLSEMLGAGHAIVRVTADIDFTRANLVEKSVDPDVKVKVKENITSNSSTTISSTGVGPAGTGSNLDAPGGGNQNIPVKSQEDTNLTEYETSTSTNEITRAAGTIRRLTVAAAVELPKPDEGQDPAKAGTGVSQEQVEAIIKQAVGFNPERNDQVEVLITELTGTLVVDNDQLIQVQKWEFFTILARNLSLGLAAFFAFVLGILTLRKMRPLTVAGRSSGRLSSERVRVLAELSSQMKQNPEVIGNILSAWMSDADQPRSTNDEETRQATRAAA